MSAPGTTFHAPSGHGMDAPPSIRLQFVLEVPRGPKGSRKGQDYRYAAVCCLLPVKPVVLSLLSSLELRYNIPMSTSR